MDTRFGLQPASQVLKSQRWSRPALAERINVPLSHLANALTGRTCPSPAVRDRLPAVLGAPLSKLFTDEALAATYSPHNGPGGRVRPGQSWLTSWDAL